MSRLTPRSIDRSRRAATPVRSNVTRAWLTPALGAVLLVYAAPLAAQLIGTAGNYGAFAGSTVTNTGSTVITGGLGVSPGTAITGFATIDGGPGEFTGSLSLGDAVAAQARDDITATYTALAALGASVDLSGQDLGGLTLTPGVYRFSSAAQLTGTLILDALGDANARFVFQIGSTLTTATAAQVTLLHLDTVSAAGAEAGVYWQIGTSATLGTSTAFVGNLLALTSITLNTGATLDDGRALAINGSVTLDANQINASDLAGGFGGSTLTPVPEPGVYGVAGCGLLLLATRRRLRPTRGARSEV